MDSDEFLKVDIKNCLCYYFDDINHVKNLDPGNEKLWKIIWNILIYNVSYDTPHGAQLLHIIFDKVDGFVRKYCRTKYLTLSGSEKYMILFNKIRNLL